MKMSTLSRMDALLVLIRQGKYEFADERICQQYMEEYFSQLGLTFLREYRLQDGLSIIDFYFPNSGVGLEVKASKKWNKMAVYRQCHRYCKNEEIKGLILATARPQGLPESINGKPSIIYLLGENGL
ncbi:hypothetical protein HNW13_018565 [Shewanella sp. BF02_Schw]|uniref:hypothetical protein n=1 Tax=Shewanella sp. BF02_Schw TaxID=394908 RepID=UPI001784F63F|nr:hypothetical protein [Shewanella sp. BF02_Schw]MBO1897745.1 hypothetical protein [Shewanella sp. BF02_Schw]